VNGGPHHRDPHDRGLQGAYGKHLVGLDRDEVAAVGRALLEEKPLTNAALAPLLAQRWPDRDAKALGNAVRAWVPLVQPPPRAVWGRSGAAAHTPIESWLGRPMVAGTLDQLVLRYLAAFGPASVKDAQNWCGLTRLKDVFERLRTSLRTFRDERGVELFDLPDAPRPDPETPAPPRFLPEYDNVLLSHADRARILGERSFSLLMSANGILYGTVLVDGYVRGQWRVLREDGVATLRIAPFEPLSPSEVDEVVEEGAALIRFAAPELEPGEVTFGELP
jgi:hypothetical protein